MNSKIGALLGPNEVEDAVLATLRLWLPAYLYEVEQDRGLDDGSLRLSGAGAENADSYRGGIDFEMWQEDELPTVIVVVKPAGPPERTASTGYGQMWDVQVCAVVAHETEDDARRLAGYYGNAIMGGVLQGDGSLGGVAEETRLSATATTSFRDPDERRLVQCIAGFHIFVQPIVNDQLGLAVPEPPAPPFGDWPTVTTTSVVITGESIQ